MVIPHPMSPPQSRPFPGRAEHLLYHHYLLFELLTFVLKGGTYIFVRNNWNSNITQEILNEWECGLLLEFFFPILPPFFPSPAWDPSWDVWGLYWWDPGENWKSEESKLIWRRTRTSSWARACSSSAMICSARPDISFSTLSWAPSSSPWLRFLRVRVCGSKLRPDTGKPSLKDVLENPSI